MASHELRILKDIRLRKSSENASDALLTLLDDFAIEGPNGKHQCLVTAMLGPSVSDMLESSRSNRLPHQWVKSKARQVFTGLAQLHAMRIGHGGEILLIASATN